MLVLWTIISDRMFSEYKFQAGIVSAMPNMCAVVMVAACFCVLLLFEAARALPEPKPEPKLQNQESEAMYSKAPPRIFVGILSGPNNSVKRDQWRNKWQCGKQLQAAGISYRFITGWPIDENRSLALHRRGQVASDSEASQANQLRHESSVYQDFKFVHFPDTYLALQSKTFALFKYGYSLGASYIVKMDDDICVNASYLLFKINEHEARVKKGGPPAFFAGWTKIVDIKGIDGVKTPYFSGLAYTLSKDLVRAIVEEESMDAVLFAPYGSYDEDAQTGRWVAFVQKHHNISVDFNSWDWRIMHLNSAHKN